MAIDANGGTVNQQESNTEISSDDNVQSQRTEPNLGAIRKSGQKEVLDVISKITGMPFSSTKDVASFFEALKNSQSDDNVQSTTTNKPITQKASDKGNGEIAELRQMIQSLQSDIAKKDTVVRQTNLQSKIVNVMGKTGFDPDYLDIAQPEFEKQIAFDEDGSFYVKGKDGNVRLDNNGDPFSLEQLASEILKSRPKLAKEDVRTGTGTKFGFKGNGNGPDDQPDAAKDPAAWRAWASRQGRGNTLKGMTVHVVDTSRNK